MLFCVFKRREYIELNAILCALLVGNFHTENAFCTQLQEIILAPIERKFSTV